MAYSTTMYKPIIPNTYIYSPASSSPTPPTLASQCAVACPATYSRIGPFSWVSYANYAFPFMILLTAPNADVAKLMTNMGTMPSAV